MRLREIIIHNFRSVRDCTIALGEYSLLVGANGVGKSTVLDAIRVFYEKDGYRFNAKTDRPFRLSDDGWESWVDLSFEVTDEEKESLAEKYHNDENGLLLRKWLRTSKKGDDGKTCQGLIFAKLPSGEWSSESFYGAKNVQSGKLGEVIYIPAISRVDEHTKLSGPSVLRDLLNTVVAGALASTDAYAALEGAISSLSDSLKNQDESTGPTLASVEKDLSDQLESWGVDFSLDFSPPAATDLVKSLVDWNLSENGNVVGADSFGSGFQRHFVFSLILTASKFKNLTESKKISKDFKPTMTLLLFEEPEAFLHPPQQDLLSRALQAESAGGRWQVVASTHSSHFVSRNAGDLVSMVRLTRENTESAIFQIGEEGWREIADKNLAIAAIAKGYPKLKNYLEEADLEPEMDVLRFFLLLNPDRSGAFFADQVLLVEGPTEVALINYLADTDRINLESGTHIIDTVGKYNTHRFMNLFGKLGIRHAVLVDDDHDKNQHVELNELIRASSNDFTISINFIPGDLEALLEAPRPGSSHRKPQHILHCLVTGALSEAGLKRFVAWVEEGVHRQ